MKKPIIQAHTSTHCIGPCLAFAWRHKMRLATAIAACTVLLVTLPGATRSPWVDATAHGATRDGTTRHAQSIPNASNRWAYPAANGLAYASGQPGSDFCVQLQNAIDTQASTGGIVIGDAPAGSLQGCAAAFTVKPGVWVYLYPVWLMPGATILVNEGGHLLGMGTCWTVTVACTTIRPTGALNGPIVNAQAVQGPTSWFHWGEVGWLRLDGSNAAGGDCLKVDQPAENSHIHNILARNCKAYPFHYTGSMSGSAMNRSLSGFNSSSGCVFLDRASSSISFQSLHCGGNVGPVFNIQGSNGGVGLNATMVQLEGDGVPGAGEPFIQVAGPAASRININGATESSVVSTTNFIKYIGSTCCSQPDVTLTNILVSPYDYPNLYNDAANGAVIAPTAPIAPQGSISQWHYGRDIGLATNSFATPHQEFSLSNGANENIILGAGGTGNGIVTFARITGPTTPFSIGGFFQGIDSTVDGHWLILHNSTSQAMTINDEDPGSSAQNRIETMTGANVTLRSGTSIATFIYSANEHRWLLVSMN